MRICNIENTQIVLRVPSINRNFIQYKYQNRIICKKRNLSVYPIPLVPPVTSAVIPWRDHLFEWLWLREAWTLRYLDLTEGLNELVETYGELEIWSFLRISRDGGETNASHMATQIGIMEGRRKLLCVSNFN